MRNLVLVTLLLLCSLDWSSAELESKSVKAPAGEKVTMQCSHPTTAPSQILWFRMTHRQKFGCISRKLSQPQTPTNCEGFEAGKFALSSDSSMSFLTIKKLNSSDTGLYFCGDYMSLNPMVYGATQLEVQGDLSEYKNLPVGILSALSSLLMVVAICLSVWIGKLQEDARDRNSNQDELLAKMKQRLFRSSSGD